MPDDVRNMGSEAERAYERAVNSGASPDEARLAAGAAAAPESGIRTFAYNDPAADLGRPIPIARDPNSTVPYADSYNLTGAEYAARYTGRPVDGSDVSLRDYLVGVQDNADNFFEYAAAGIGRTLLDVGTGIGDTVVAMVNDPRSTFAGVGKGVVNFGPEAFNSAVNLAKTSLDGWTLLAEAAGAPEGFFSGFRETDAYNIGLLSPYANQAEAGGAFLANIGMGVGAAKYGAYSLRSPITFTPVPAYSLQGMTFVPPGLKVRNPLVAPGAGSSGTGAQLLLGEGDVGTYDELIAAGSKGDNITPHHIPSANHMAQYGVGKGDGIAINMEHPFPGTGGRHRLTFTYGTDADLGLSARDALSAGVWDARRIYRQQGLYDASMRQQLQAVIQQNKLAHPEIFAKPPR